jgi:hypothetical protein
MSDTWQMQPQQKKQPFRQFVNNMYYEWVDEQWEYTKQAPSKKQEQYYLDNKQFLIDKYKENRG